MSLLKIFPGFPIDNISNTSPSYSIFFRQLFHANSPRLVSRSNLSHLRFGEFRSYYFFSSWVTVGMHLRTMSASPFGDSIRSIGGIGSKPQVAALRIFNAVDDMHVDRVVPDTRGIIPFRAIVTDGLIRGRPMACRQPPCHLRHRYSLPPASIRTYSDQAIAEPVMRSGGQPTPVRFLDARPEQFGRRLLSPRVRDLCSTRLRAVLPSPGTQSTGDGFKSSTASKTGTLNRHRRVPSVGVNAPAALTSGSGHLCVTRTLQLYQIGGGRHR